MPRVTPKHQSNGRAGVLRLYDRAAVETVRNESEMIEQRQGAAR